MVKSRTSLWIVLIVIVGAWTVSGCAHRSPEKRAEWMTAKISSRLGLNEGQKDRLNGLKNELIEKERELRASRSAFKKELIDQLQGEKIDQEKLREMIKKEEAELDETASDLLARLSEFYDGLTPEQRAELGRIVGKWGGHLREHDRSEG
jgi:protein CpxP